ncbi:uncharacterized protein [Euphorbia lathyris]|uniref:uncharacterized protein isoform X3 n=1 Tax=Euphorbia lathyris TaxID=212925 RepID=UPI003313E224
MTFYGLISSCRRYYLVGKAGGQKWRSLSLAVLDSRGHLLVALGYGLWPSMVLISEIVQTFTLADFCYYYIKSVFRATCFSSSFRSGVVAGPRQLWSLSNITSE